MINIDKNYITECLFENNKTLFITITNIGYIEYTLNLLKSLHKLLLDKKIYIFCLDEVSYNRLSFLGYKTHLIKTDLSSYYSITDNEFDKIGYIKMLLIYKIIELGYNCLYTDGDIYFKQNPLEYIETLKDIDGDAWIQNDTLQDNNYGNVCTGYMYIRSNDITKKYFNCESSDIIKIYKSIDLPPYYDQGYFNKCIKMYLNLHLFPLDLFPNGNYFYTNNNKIYNNIMVHFNWVVGHKKKEIMKQYNMWLLIDNEEDNLRF